jgi:hypothetical protein
MISGCVHNDEMNYIPCRDKRAMPIIIDPGLYQSTKQDVFWANPKRPLPTAFKLFTGWFPPSHFISVHIIMSLVLIHGKSHCDYSKIFLMI